MANEQPRIIMANAFIDALIERGVITAEDRVRRVIIDARYGEALAMYVERLGDERMLNVVCDGRLDLVKVQAVEESQ